MNWDRTSSFKCVLVYIFGQDMIILKITSWGFPSSIDTLLIVKLFKYSIAPKKNEIIVIPNFEAFYIWSWDHTFWIAAIPWIFSFNIPDSPWHRKATWEYSMGSYDHLNSRSIIWWWIWYIALVLINLSSIFLDSFGFNIVFWLVIFG